MTELPTVSPMGFSDEDIAALTSMLGSRGWDVYEQIADASMEDVVRLGMEDSATEEVRKSSRKIYFHLMAILDFKELFDEAISEFNLDKDQS